LKRRQAGAVVERNREVLAAIFEIKSQQPFWGYRHVTAYLRYDLGIQINRKRVLRLMRENGLLVKTHQHHLRASRTPLRSKLRASMPNEVWGTDMTKVMVEGFGWVYIVVVLDWYTKQIVGCHIGLRSRTSEWLTALDRALNRQFPNGIQGHPLKLVSDNGSQPTSRRYIETCKRLGIEQVFTSYNNPKGNADTERVIRTMKEGLVYLQEWRDPIALTKALVDWVAWYNGKRRHSTLGYRTPNEFAQKFDDQPTLLLYA
jgi:transposase InsO family protein